MPVESECAELRVRPRLPTRYSRSSLSVREDEFGTEPDDRDSNDYGQSDAREDEAGGGVANRVDRDDDDGDEDEDENEKCDGDHESDDGDESDDD